VVFDFDRTLVNLLDFTDWNYARQLVAKSYLENQVPKDIVTKHNRGPFRLFYNVYNELVPRYSRNLLKKIQLDASRALEKCEVEGALKAELMLQCRENLEWIKKRGIKIGVVSTNSRRSVEVASSRLNIARFLDVIVGRRPLPEKMKPYPHQVLVCLKKLACKPDEAMMVGDGYDDMLAARRSNVFAVAVLTGRIGAEELAKAGADRLIENLSELPKSILETCG
jgi:phosphoglycolate phosphatase-like HAD superfamily hydrolase